MATRQEHYAAAEEWLRRAQQAWENEDTPPGYAEIGAQVAAQIATAHATLAGVDTDAPYWYSGNPTTEEN